MKMIHVGKYCKTNNDRLVRKVYTVYTNSNQKRRSHKGRLIGDPTKPSIHMDICGDTETKYHGGNRYF